ncbi:MAG: DUF4433 domain-containing protein [Moritella sp.]|uniref:DarT ssDNA thymidine ADP-ribosyltransferase family protein n=1 Tax=Moritella sp. TaxID=78556 RepID=UPI001DFEED60|nr:DarT ssDNA thymidine ADP-ribosyltransferase family protein [Moritella sp.]NQZ52428.1 DUF4433 domain-containing protein [Moritella sp.]
MTIQEIVSSRQISQVVHFTTNLGLVGILSLQSLKARGLLKDEEILKYILKYNSTYRSDPAWTNHVNLSLSNINVEFFNYCKGWHSDIYWCVLCFTTDILQHKKVVFTTTNNIYPSNKRATGPEGLLAMFADQVTGKRGAITIRDDDKIDNETTDIQAEVLYPRAIDIKYLTKIIVSSDEDSDNVSGLTHSLDLSNIVVEINENAFKY